MPVYVTSQEDMNDSHFLPLDIASTCNLTSMLFYEEKIERNDYRCWSRFSLGILSTTHTFVEMTKFSVCVCHEGS